MSGVGDLAGRDWQEWPTAGESDDVSPISASPFHSSCDITPSSSRASSPPPHTAHCDDVMKLPKRDMHVFGHCPVQDEIVVGICESCGLIVKIEALESHVRLRHGLPLGVDPLSSAVSISSRSSDHSNSCFSNLLKHQPVDLSKITAKLKHGARIRLKSGSSSHTPCPPTSRSKSPSPEKERVVSPDVKVKEETGFFSNDGSPGVDVEATKENSTETSSSRSTPLDFKVQQEALSTSPKIVRPPSIPTQAKFKPKVFREYNPESHCGVWNNDGSRQCTRSLTCKTHSISLKRKIAGRSRPFDELLAAYKKTQSNLAPVAGSSVCLQPAAPSAPLESVQPRLITPSKLIVRLPIHPSTKRHRSMPKIYEDFSFTNDHPKPLAVCTYNATRFGGLVLCGRNRALTAKLVKVSLNGSVGPLATSGLCRSLIPLAPSPGAGFQRITPKLTMISSTTSTSSPITIFNCLKRRPVDQAFVINYNNVSKRSCTASLRPSSPMLNPDKLQDSFKTDIQDFKGGIKFEYGSRIKLTQLNSETDPG